MTTLSPYATRHFLLRGALLLALLAISACSATPISIPGQSDGGVASPDFSTAADASGPDGLTLPDSGTGPADASPSPDFAAPDASATDGLVDGLTDGIVDGLVDGLSDADGALHSDAAGEAGASGDAGQAGDAVGG